MIPYSKFIIWMALLVQTVYQIVNYSHVVSYFLYVPYILTLLVVFLSGAKIEIPKGYRAFYIAMVLCYFIGPIFGGNINSSSFTYMALLIIFSLSVVAMGHGLSYDLLNIKKMAFIGAIFLIFLVITHLDAYNFSDMYDALGLNGTRNTSLRESFGFWHPNAAGYMFGTEIILLTFTISMEKRIYKKIIELALIFIFALSMLASGCRTAVITVLVFFSIKLTLKFTRIFFRARIFILIIIAALLFSYFISSDGLNSLVEATSGRNLTVGNVIQYLSQEDKMLFGYGATRISEGSIGMTIDNWYLNMLAYYGLFGFVCMITGIFLLVCNLYKGIRSISEVTIRENTISFIVMFFLYGLCENVIYVPGVTLCAVFWIVMNMIYFYASENMYDKIK